LQAFQMLHRLVVIEDNRAGSTQCLGFLEADVIVERYLELRLGVLWG
jgi:hypothetical protein